GLGVPRGARPLWLGAGARRQRVMARGAGGGLRARGLVERAREGGRGLVLSARGDARGRQVVRSHRLWETYLAKHFALPIDHLHEPAHRAEHFVRGALEEGLAAEVGREGQKDPHGREIP
ncbi:MAG: metal-dependent transcriptional regulator, partial [Phycisphaerales bacterium]